MPTISQPPADTAKIASARQQLRDDMASHGMTAEGGWNIHEETRAASDGRICVLRPVHATRAAPAGYVVAIKLRG